MAKTQKVKEQQKRYRQSAKGKAKTKLYNSYPAARKRRARFMATPKGREYNRRYKERRREWVQQEKLKRGCVDCGYNKHPAALDFDHVRGVKCFEISRAARSLQKLKDEIAKCVVRCANCHRIKTFEEQKANVG